MHSRSPSGLACVFRRHATLAWLNWTQFVTAGGPIQAPDAAVDLETRRMAVPLDPRQSVHIARQAVMDANRRACGYELL
jgi:hypothetical protein